jgi:hypothetical protein
MHCMHCIANDLSPNKGVACLNRRILHVHHLNDLRFGVQPVESIGAIGMGFPVFLPRPEIIDGREMIDDPFCPVSKI